MACDEKKAGGMDLADWGRRRAFIGWLGEVALNDSGGRDLGRVVDSDGQLRARSSRCQCRDRIGDRTQLGAGPGAPELDRWRQGERRVVAAEVVLEGRPGRRRSCERDPDRRRRRQKLHATVGLESAVGARAGRIGARRRRRGRGRWPPVVRVVRIVRTGGGREPCLAVPSRAVCPTA